MMGHVLLAALLSYTPMPPSPSEIATAEAIAAEMGAVATAPAVRTGSTVQLEETLPPPPTQPPVPAFSSDSYNGRCVGAEPLIAWYSPGWDVARMSRIMYRESRCDPSADNAHSSASGLFQILSSLHCGWISNALGPCNLYNANYNIRAAALLWQKSGYGAWSQTN